MADAAFGDDELELAALPTAPLHEVTAPAVPLQLDDALAGLGWPPCPGGIMVVNPEWRRPLAQWREAIADWLYGHHPEGAGLMRLAMVEALHELMSLRLTRHLCQLAAGEEAETTCCCPPR